MNARWTGLAVAASSLALLQGACGGGGGESIEQIDFSFAETETLAAPERLAVTEAEAWFAVSGAVVAVDAQTRRVGVPHDVVADVEGLAADPEAVWVANDDDGTVLRVDAATGQVSAPIPVIPEDGVDILGNFRGPMAVGENAVWVAYRDGIARIDVESLRVLPGEVPENAVSDLAISQGVVWAATASGGLLRIDEATAEITGQAEIADSAGDLALRDGQVWLTADALYRIDPDTLEPVGEATPFEAEDVSSVVAGPVALWGLVREQNEVLRIDPDSGGVTGRFALDSPYSSQSAELSSVEYGAGAVWVGTSIGNRAGVIATE